VIEAVIFDIDGTLIDSVDLHARAWQDALAHFGHPVAFQDVRAQIGKGGDQLMPVFLTKAQLKEFGKPLETYRGDLFKREYLARVKAFPGVRTLFERIRQDGTRIALASSAKEDELASYIRIAGIEGLTEVETSSDDASRSKPHPDIFHAAMAALGGDLDPTRVVVVGDTPYDAEAAGKAGLRTVGVRCGGFPDADLLAAGCIALFDGPADLLANFERSPLARGA